MRQRTRLLILDDEPIVGKRLAPALSKMGCEIESFVDPDAALKRLEEAEFDIVVTDIRMDKIDGLEVLERVLARSPRSKVIMITGYATLEVAREALAKGAFDFIAKPFKPEDMRKAVAKALGSLGVRVENNSKVASDENPLPERV